MRFFAFDRVLELEPGKRIVLVKCTSLADENLRGHFPKRPLTPGVTWLEAMVQALGWLVIKSSDFRILTLLSVLEDVQVPPAVMPGQKADVTAEIHSSNRNGTMGTAHVDIDGKRVASIGRMILAHYHYDPAVLRKVISDFSEST